MPLNPTSHTPTGVVSGNAALEQHGAIAPPPPPDFSAQLHTIEAEKNKLSKASNIVTKILGTAIPPALDSSPVFKAAVSAIILRRWEKQPMVMAENDAKKLLDTKHGDISKCRDKLHAWYTATQASQESRQDKARYRQLFSKLDSELRMMALNLATSHQSFTLQGSLPYFGQTQPGAQPDPARKKYLEDHEAIKAGYSAIKENIGKVGEEEKVTEQLANLDKALQSVSPPLNAMLENILNGISTSKNLSREKKMAPTAQGMSDLFFKHLPSLSTDAIATQSKIAELPLLQQLIADRKNPVSPEMSEARREIYQISSQLSKKNSRFVDNVTRFFEHVDKHTGEPGIQMLRGFGKQANALARQYAGFGAHLDKVGLGEHKAAFETLEQRLRNMHLCVDYELRKRDVDPDVPAMKKKSQAGGPQHPALRKMVGARQAQGKSPTSASAPSSASKPPPSDSIEEEDENDDLMLLAKYAGLARTKSPAEVKEMKINDLTKIVQHCENALAETEKTLRKTPDKALEDHSKPEIDKHIKEENWNLELHKLRTNEAISNLRKLGNLSGEDMNERIQKLRDDHVALAIDVCTNTLLPNEDAFNTLIEHGHIQEPFVVTQEARPYIREPSGDDPGERNLFDVIPLKTKDGKVWAEAHPHYAGDPDTKTAFLTETGKKQYLVVNLKHPDQAVDGRTYEMANPGKKVHRSVMATDGFVSAIEVAKAA